MPQPFDEASDADSAGAAREKLAPRWRAFISGTKLPPGPAITLVVLLSLLLWAGIIAAAWYLLRG